MLTALPLAAAEEDFAQGLATLAGAESYADKEAAAATIGSSGHPRAETVLSAMLEGQLYTRRSDNRVVTAADADDGFALRDAVTDEDLGAAGRRDVSRITVNNQLRGALRSMLATLKLRHEDPDERIAAVRNVGESEDMAMLPTLAALLETERHSGVREAIEMAMATINLDSDDAAIRLASIRTVAANVGGHVRTKLNALATNE
jgi:urea transport system permease protein